MNNGGQPENFKSLYEALLGAAKIPVIPPKPSGPTKILSDLYAASKPVRISAPVNKPSVRLLKTQPNPLYLKVMPAKMIPSATQKTYSDNVAASIRNILSQPLTVTKSNDVPYKKDISLTGGVQIETAVLYIDIRKSTSITDRHNDDVAAKIYKAYLEAMVSIARYQGRGHIRGFAGDKIMILFDNEKNAMHRALDCAIWMQSFVEQKLAPALSTYYDHPIECGIGIDYGKMTVVRGGTKNNNDTIWAGSPANRASKLADSTQGGEIRISASAMARIKSSRDAESKYKLSSAKPVAAAGSTLLSKSVYTTYRLSKIRYQL